MTDAADERVAVGDGRRHPDRDGARRRRSASRSRIRRRISRVSTTSCGSTAPDGYTASRSYSVASPPDGSNAIELTVERLDDGEVSTFLHDEVVIGDELEVRGPIGGWFVWKGDTPALLVGGGSGIVPLMAMLRPGAQDRNARASCTSSCRCARPTTSSTPASCPAPRRRSSTHADATRGFTRARAAHGGRRRAARHSRRDRVRVRFVRVRRRGQRSARRSSGCPCTRSASSASARPPDA